ncbi:hypothetical protein O181_048095 [Austropuccinia psidii MF-1]|uniref:Uncharacterized protein n=1 Tax=Austropuccinia psidii MF-1 TaxID=1389203 RepID=A0A9Q3DRC6_9BASI|nr:hypothetical protein [Austropuccinia psidii MF-1]
MAAYNIWAGMEVGESLPEGSRVVTRVPGKGLGKILNINSTKKTNKKRHTFEAAKNAQYEDDYMINVEGGHIDNEPPHTESPPYSMKPLPPLLKIFKLFKKGRQLNIIQWGKI